jgi:ATP/maltotriose-dependent transcriptional regulator MalT
MMPYLLLGHSWAQGSVGQLAEAVRSAEAAEEMAHLLSRSDLLGYALALRAAAVSMRDSPDTAAPLAERALRHISPRGRLWGLAATVLGLIRLDQDRPGDCLALVESVSAKAQLSGPAWCVKATWYSAAARAEAVRGRLDAARGWADRAAEAAEAVDLDGQRAHALTARAYSLPVTSDEALELLGAALKGFEASGLVLGAAQTRLLLAQRHFATDRTDQAAEHIEQAKRTATAYGAGHLCALAVDAQRRLGARMPRGIGLVIPGPELSTREEVIVGLVTQGLSNRRIAESMYVSVKTVEAHLTRIFRKYGVSSRSALVSEYLHAAGTGSR